MANIQFINQENQANFVGSEQYHQPSTPAATSKPSVVSERGRSMRFVPIAIFLAFIFICGLVFYKWRANQAVTDNGVDLIPAANHDNDVVPEASRQAIVQPQDQLGAPATAQPTSAPIVAARPRVTVTADPAPRANPAPVSKGGQVVAATPVQTNTITNVTQTVSSNTTDHVTVTIKKEQADDSYKPGLPSLNDCGGWSDDRWHPNVTLPRFTKDDKSAVEYWVQIGTGQNESNVKDEKYRQGEEVHLSFTAENDKEYFVRFAIRMENGDWQKWSNTLKLKCKKDW